MNLEQLIIEVSKSINAYYPLIVMLSIFFIFSAFFPIRPVFSSLYGPLIIKNFNDTNKPIELSKSFFRVFSTYLIMAIMFSFVGVLILIFVKIESTGISLDTIKSFIEFSNNATTQNELIDLQRDKVYILVVTPLSETFKLIGLFGVVIVATGRILSVMYNTFMIPHLLRTSITCVGMLMLLGLYDLEIFTVLTDTLKLSFFDAPFYLFKISFAGFVATEFLIYLSSSYLKKARITPYFLQRQRQEIFEIDEQFFSRALYLKNWKRLVEEEIKENGINSIKWVSYSFTKDQYCSIINSALYFYKGDTKKVNEILKTAVKLITTEKHYQSFIKQFNPIVNEYGLNTNIVKKKDQSTFISVNNMFVIVTLPIPHERISNEYREIDRKYQSNLAFVTREPDRINYYLNRFKFLWESVENELCCNLSLKCLENLKSTLDQKLFKYLIAYLHNHRWDWDLNELIKKIVIMHNLEGYCEESINEIIQILKENNILKDGNGNLLFPTERINYFTKSCIKCFHENTQVV